MVNPFQRPYAERNFFVFVNFNIWNILSTDILLNGYQISIDF